MPAFTIIALIYNWVKYLLKLSWVQYMYFKNIAFTLMEMMISMLIISIMLIATVPLLTQFSTLKTGIDKNVAKCITENNSSGWYTDSTGDTSTPASGTVCNAAVLDTQYNRGRAFNTSAWYAVNGTSNQQIMAKKILRDACDLGGEKACDFFINICWKGANGSAPYCDDTAGFNDVTYYLHQNKDTNTNFGAIYIYNQLLSILPKIPVNLVNEVFYAASNNQTPDNNQNINNNLAWLLAQPWIYIKACNFGNINACKTSFNNNYNKSCSQIKTVWNEAPTGNYSITYNGTTGDSETVNCNMSSLASAAITGCNANTANLLSNAPNDDCSYGYNHGYNQTCAVVKANWPTYPTGTYKLTPNGPPPTVTVSTACTNNPPNHAACMAAGIGHVCDDGTVYAGDYGGRHYFTTPSDQGTYCWNNCQAGIAIGANNTTYGLTNYNKLINATDSDSPYQAAQACLSLNNGPSNYGVTDWYLPSKGELNLLYTNRSSIGNFRNTHYDADYWSSSEFSSTYAYFQKFDTNEWYWAEKNSSDEFYVRCIRSQAASDASCPNKGNTCSNGTKYAGYYNSRYIFTTPNDEPGNYAWNNGTSMYALNETGANDPNYGKTNYNILVAASDSGAPYNAEGACKTLNNATAYGYTDWYLPAVDEMSNILYPNYCAIGNFDDSGTNYWTSTEIDGVYSTFFRFNDGIYSNEWKAHSDLVRCLRSE